VAKNRLLSCNVREYLDFRNTSKSGCEDIDKVDIGTLTYPTQ
jgi:hypothetical protein